MDFQFHFFPWWDEPGYRLDPSGVVVLSWLHDYFADTPAAYTRYSTIFYEGLREAGKAYADVKELQELGRMDEAREVIREKRDVLALRKQLNQVQRRLSAINGRMDAVRLGELDADAKRLELDRLLVIKERLTAMVGKRVEDMRAKR